MIRTFSFKRDRSLWSQQSNCVNCFWIWLTATYCLGKVGIDKFIEQVVWHEITLHKKVIVLQKHNKDRTFLASFRVSSLPESTFFFVLSSNRVTSSKMRSFSSIFSSFSASRFSNYKKHAKFTIRNDIL